MKRIVLNFIGTGVHNKCQACVNIYDTCGNLLCSNKTYNGKLTLYLKEDRVYRLIATSCNDVIDLNLYIDKYKSMYTFIFSRAIFTNSLRTITFLLTDANYNDLPIEEGKMILWQKQ